MARQHPLLNIHTCYGDRKVDLIGEGFDCAIRIGLLQDSNLLAKLICPLFAKWVASPDYIASKGAPETPDEFVRHQCVMQGAEIWPVAIGGKVMSMSVQGRFKADNGVALVSAALEGLGIAGLPFGLVEDHLASGALVEIMPHFPPPKMGVYVIRPSGQNPSRKIRVLTDMLIENHARFGARSRAAA